ncbi:MAG: helix-turn-helix domain-containing protein [Actinomycetota bacterium]|nr:helix-turn-helix domain-containing protein [Actinomycetota bacterium]
MSGAQFELTGPEPGSRPAARAPRNAVALKPAGAVRLFEADPDLAGDVPEEIAPRLRRHVIVEVCTLERGPWQPLHEDLAGRAPFGLLVLEGALTRRVAAGRRHAAELLGRGDLIRPDQPDADEYAVVAQQARWSVLERAELALLDHDFVAGVAGIPGVLPRLAARAIDRSRALVLRLAIAQIPNMPERVHLLLWHLADRWGRREAGSVVLQLRLPQDLIAELLGAHRSSVNSALHDLAERGVIERRGVAWALCGDPPGDLLARI